MGIVSSTLTSEKAYRLVNTRFPAIDIFDDCASVEEFEVLFALQSLTNPRLQNEVGDLTLLSHDQIPFGITGCSYATASFTHINRDGSRFSNGEFGVLYMADTMKTAIAETRYHVQKMLSLIEGLHFEMIVMKALSCTISGELIDIRANTIAEMQTTDIYHHTDYTASQNLGFKYRKQAVEGLHYTSVRNPMSSCYALFTPKRVEEIIQSTHYEYVWDGKSIEVRGITAI